MSTPPITVSKRATMAMIVSFTVFLVVGAAVALITGPVDIYTLSSLILLVPLVTLLYFAMKRKAWAYVGSMILGIFVVAAIPASIGNEMSPILIWGTGLATILGVLIALESFKAYAELKKP